ncbi:MAG: LamG domain-containing protein [Planctomycetota bacterium]
MSRQFIRSIFLVLISGFLLTNVAGAIGLGDPDLIGYWPFDEAAGTTTADRSLNGYEGTLYGGTTWTDGVYGAALQFDGSDAYVGTNLSLLNDLGAFTLACWVSGSNTTIYTSIIGQNDMVEFGFTSENGGQLGVWMVGNQWQFVGADYDFPYPSWHHVALTGDPSGVVIYIDGEVAGSDPGAVSSGSSGFPFNIGGYVFNDETQPQTLEGEIDDVFVFGRALSQQEIQSLMQGIGKYPYALGPDPADGALYPATWVTLSWKPGDLAASHDVYMGDNFDDVNNGTGDTFRGNLPLDTTFYFAGFAPGAYPDGLVPGTTYYWRIDEVNDAEPNSPWKGEIWSFMVPPKTAYFPDPADGAEFVDLNVRLTWTPGYGAKMHYVVFGEDFDEVSNAPSGVLSTGSFNPGPLKLAKTYYWRVDESDGVETYKGQVWSFTTEGAVSGPSPADGAVDVEASVILGWVAGAVAASHEVYFGTDAEAVANATIDSPEYKGPKALGEESYDPGKLAMNTTYFWRIDEVNDVNPDSPWEGHVWSFTTGDYFVIDDFEDYNADDNQIWYSWHDGLGAGSPGAPDYLPGNGTGSAVGDETNPSYTEETIVHGGNQSMPVEFANGKQGYAYYSQVEHTLTDQRDWTEQGVAELSLWFRGYPASVGSFVEDPAGTYTMTGSGADIWAVDGVEADEFHYAFKTLTGAGSISARVQSVSDTHTWAKAGVMIRETLDPESAHAMMVVTPGSGVSFQRRPGTGATSIDDTTADITAPYWVKIERELSGNFSAYSSADGSTWQKLGVSESIQMASNVYIGLAVTAHNASATCQAVFTNVTTTGTVGSQWMNQDIGIESNDAEPLYVAVSNPDGIGTGEPAVVVHDDANAAQIDDWTEWVIPLQAFADQGIDLTDIDKIAIGLGTKGNVTTPGGSGKMYFDDIRLYLPRKDAQE